MVCSAEYTDLPSAETVPRFKVVGSGDPKRYPDSVASVIMVGICGRLSGRMSCRFPDRRHLHASEFLLPIVKILQRSVKQFFGSAFACMMECEAF